MPVSGDHVHRRSAGQRRYMQIGQFAIDSSARTLAPNIQIYRNCGDQHLEAADTAMFSRARQFAAAASSRYSGQCAPATPHSLHIVCPPQPLPVSSAPAPAPPPRRMRTLDDGQRPSRPRRAIVRHRDKHQSGRATCHTPCRLSFELLAATNRAELYAPGKSRDITVPGANT